MASAYEFVPKCPQYHPDSDRRIKSGCYPNISTEILEKISVLKCRIDTIGLDINEDDEIEFLKLLRFLRAKKFDLDRAYDAIVLDTRWRLECDVANLRRQHAVDTLDCSVVKILEYLPTWVQGYDKQFRPVSYQQIGKFEVLKALKIATMESLIRFHVWQMEQTLRMMYEQSRYVELNIESFTVVLDAEGFSLRLATGDAYVLLKALISLDSAHYPERLGTLVVINAPSVLWVTWRIVQGFLDDVTRSKIRILGDSSEWRPVLQELIDSDQIPLKYGGSAPDLSLQESIEVMNPGQGVKRYIPEKKETSFSSPTKTATSLVTDTAIPALEVPHSTPKKQSLFGSWLNFLQCKTPHCGTGDDDFDFVMSSPNDGFSPKDGPIKDDSSTDSDTDPNSTPVDATTGDANRPHDGSAEMDLPGSEPEPASPYSLQTESELSESMKAQSGQGGCGAAVGCECTIC